jgi:hypothetical protein
MGDAMSSTVATGGELDPDLATGCEHRIAVALGRRVEVLGDLLLPPEPTDSSRAGCRDIARRLEEWQGPGVVILCGRLVAPVADDDQEAAAALRAHTTLVEALRTFSARPDSRVVAVLSPHHDPGLIGPLEKLGVSVYPAVDLVCETGAGIRTVLVRAGTLRPGWLAWNGSMTRACPAAS